METKFYWNEADGSMVCVITEGKKKYRGEAKCHKNDEIFKSKRVGSYIADLRAQINMANTVLKEDLLPQFKSLKHLKNSMEQSYRYNEKSYEARVMKKEYYYLEEQIKQYRKFIKARKKELAKYISSRKEYQKKYLSKNGQ